MNIVGVLNMKGGVGKTTTTANLSHALARLGRRVLAVDLDAQANLTTWLGEEEDAPRAVLAHVLKDARVIREAIGPSRAVGVDLLYGSSATSITEQEMVGDKNPSTVLRRALRQLTEYDDIVLDCPPGLGLITINAIAASNEVLVPIETQTMALSGVGLLMQNIEDLLSAEVLSAAPKIRAVATKFDGRNGLARAVLQHLRSSDGISTMSTTIRSNIRLAECYGLKKTIFDHAPDAPGAADYAELAREFTVAPSIV
jgi:chromosome partitioning protein